MGRRSVSQLNTFSECGERYRLERTTHGLPQRPAAWTAVGTAMHNAYEAYERSGRDLNIATLFYDIYEAEIASQWEVQPDWKWWAKTPRVKTVERDIELRLEHGLKQAQVLQDHCEMSDWKIATIGGVMALEMEVEATFGETRVIGRIDSVQEYPDGQLAATDLKTGNKKGTKNRQLGFYKLALMERFDVNIQWGQFWYTKLGASGGYVDLGRYTRDYLHDQYTKLDKAIEQQLFLANPGDHCDMCSVKWWCREVGSITP